MKDKQIFTLTRNFYKPPKELFHSMLARDYGMGENGLLGLMGSRWEILWTYILTLTSPTDRNKMPTPAERGEGMASSLFNGVEHYANCTVNFFPNADAARSSVIKVIEAFSGSSRRSRAARLVFMRFAISVFDNFLFFQRGRLPRLIQKIIQYKDINQLLQSG